MLLGTTTDDGAITYGEHSVKTTDLLSIYENKLEPVYACNIDQGEKEIPTFNYKAEGYPAPSIKAARPRVLIPVFPGTNCEYDTAKALADAGADPEIIVVKNLTSADIAESVDYFAKQARQALAAIQEEWDQIGYVPRDEVRRIEGRLDAVDKQIKAIEDAAWKQSDPEADARKSSFEEQLNAQLAELDQKIAAESDPKKKAKLESEKATKEQWLNAIK